MPQQFVRLKYVESDGFAPGGGIGFVDNTVISVRVKNVAPTKDVAIHYLDEDTGGWQEESLNWLSNFGDYDLFAHTDNTFITTRFALRYTVNGITYWDNNGGLDYRVSEEHPDTVGGNVTLGKATAHRGFEAGGGFEFTTSWVDGEIWVKNLSYNKRVGIRLTADNWLSFVDTQAGFSALHAVAEGQPRVEVWKFKTPEMNLDSASSEFQFAIFYQDLDTGQWFWDDNFGQNYRVSKQDLTTIS